jgi:hypothetical protein
MIFVKGLKKVSKFKKFLNESWEFKNNFIGKVILKDFYELNRVDWDGEVAGKIKYSVLEDVVEIVESNIYGDMVDLFRNELEKMYPNFTIVGL